MKSIVSVQTHKAITKLIKSWAWSPEKHHNSRHHQPSIIEFPQFSTLQSAPSRFATFASSDLGVSRRFRQESSSRHAVIIISDFRETMHNDLKKTIQNMMLYQPISYICIYIYDYKTMQNDRRIRKFCPCPFGEPQILTVPHIRRYVRLYAYIKMQVQYVTTMTSPWPKIHIYIFFCICIFVWRLSW